MLRFLEMFNLMIERFRVLMTSSRSSRTQLVTWCVHITAVKTNFVVMYVVYILATNYIISL